VVVRVVLQALLDVVYGEAQPLCVFDHRLVDLNVVVVVVYVCLLALPLAPVLVEVVDQHVALLYLLLLYFLCLLVLLLLHLLLVGVLVVHAVVEVLVVQFLVVPVQLAHSRVEADHQVLVFQQALGHRHDLLRRLVACLSVEGAQDYTAGRVVLQQAVLVGLDAALGELGVEVVWLARGLVVGQAVFGQLVLLLLEVLEFLLLNDVSELLAYQLQLLFIEDVDVVGVVVLL